MGNFWRNLASISIIVVTVGVVIASVIWGGWEVVLFQFAAFIGMGYLLSRL